MWGKDKIKRIRKLVITLGIGEISMASVKVFDFLAASTLGVQQFAGFAFATNFLLLLSAIIYTETNILVPLYYRNKDLRDIKSYMLWTGIITVISGIVLVIVSNILLRLVWLSDNAKNSVPAVIIIGTIGCIVNSFSCGMSSYYIVEGFERRVSTSRILCAVTNIVLDIVSVCAGLGVVGIITSTAVAQGVELLYLMCSDGRKCRHIFKQRVKVIDFKMCAIELGSTISLYLSDFVMNYIVSFAGDLCYAAYSIVYQISEMFCYFAYNYTDITTVMYSKEIENFCVKIQLEFLKYSAGLALIIYPVSSVVAGIMTRGTGVNISTKYLALTCSLFVLCCQLGDYYLGVLRIHNNQNSILVMNIVRGVIAVVLTGILIGFTQNPYILISPWYVYYIVGGIYCYFKRREERTLE